MRLVYGDYPSSPGLSSHLAYGKLLTGKCEHTRAVQGVREGRRKRTNGRQQKRLRLLVNNCIFLLVNKSQGVLFGRLLYLSFKVHLEAT